MPDNSWKRRSKDAAIHGLDKRRFFMEMGRRVAGWEALAVRETRRVAGWG